MPGITAEHSLYTSAATQRGGAPALGHTASEQQRWDLNLGPRPFSNSRGRQV